MMAPIQQTSAVPTGKKKKKPPMGFGNIQGTGGQNNSFANYLRINNSSSNAGGSGLETGGSRGLSRDPADPSYQAPTSNQFPGLTQPASYQAPTSNQFPGVAQAAPNYYPPITSTTGYATGGGAGGPGGLANYGGGAPSATSITNPSLAGATTPGQWGTSPLANAIEDAQFGNAYANPDQLAALWFQQGGYNPSGGGYATTQDMAQNMPLQWLLGSNDTQLAGGMGNYVDYSNDYLNRATGPGRLAGATDIFGSIFNPQNSTTSDMLSNQSLNYNDQVQNLVATLGQGLSGVLPPPVLKALVDEAQLAGQQWGAAQLQNPMQNQTFAQYFLAHSKMGPALQGLIG